MNYDTLDDLKDEVCTLQNLYEAVIGKAVNQGGIGTLTTGSLCLRSNSETTWGRSVGFTDESSIYSVRSHPKGRLGLPLRIGELRKVTVLVCSTKTSRIAHVTTIKLWLLESLVNKIDLEKCAQPCLRGTKTFGALGVSISAVSLADAHLRLTACTSSVQRRGCLFFFLWR